MEVSGQRSENIFNVSRSCSRTASHSLLSGVARYDTSHGALSQAGWARVGGGGVVFSHP